MVEGQIKAEHEAAHLLGRTKFADGQAAAVLVIDNELREGVAHPAQLQQSVRPRACFGNRPPSNFTGEIQCQRINDSLAFHLCNQLLQLLEAYGNQTLLRAQSLEQCLIQAKITLLIDLEAPP